ncbi:sulfate ABC transporter substrate-binding protein [Devosia salina]|uniref:Sulfate ABC transporter substrate-binding protein n=1 Tax=Devosia salina TaxID=2860336 RepID=A0ABX8WM00_9HYPH|nr:sulfate ABC transporter substrate-binding protein [Devosia salina]QYO78021.1 sulfate ABC transporter substrate-binding protein [Devosia salina]
MKTAARILACAGLVAALAFSTIVTVAAQSRTLINVSYDPTREFYEAFNQAFVTHWQALTGEAVAVQTTHGGSGAQARSVIEGLPADVVTLALESDINAIADHTGRIRSDWRGTLPHDNAPYTSTIVFLVRKGNPRQIADWDDLVADGVQVITPNPKTSGGARWNVLAAWAWALAQPGGNEETARDYLARLFSNVPVLDTGARAATITFAQRGLGDVLIAWENEALLTLAELGADKFEIVTPSVSILAEPSVAIVDANVDARGTRDLAQAYLEYLYSPEGQSLAASHYFRPADPSAVEPQALSVFADLDLRRVDDFGGWRQVQQRFFDEGGIFDQVFEGNF